MAVYVGDAGNNTFGGVGNVDDTASGFAGNDSLAGGDGNDSLLGGEGNDQLRGDAGNDTMRGGQGDDYMTGGSGDDALFGGAGFDTADYFFSDSNAGIAVDLVAGTATGGGGSDTLASIEHISATDFNDTVSGNDLNNSLDGRSGNDSLVGLGGDDSLFGGNGDDTLVGGIGSDYLHGGDGNDSMLGGAGLGFDFFEGGAGNDYIDGGVSVDIYFGNDTNTLTYRNSSFAVYINMAGVSGDGSVGSGFANKGLGGIDTLLNLTSFTGSGLNDTIIGSAAGIFESFEGGLGDDVLNGGAYETTFLDGFNQVTYQNSPGAVTVDLRSGIATGASGNDILLNFHRVRGGGSSDTLYGTDTTLYTEHFEGRGGNDTIDGRGGSDRVRYNYLSNNQGVYANLATGVAIAGVGDVDTLINIERVQGSQYNDTLIGGNPDFGADQGDGFEELRGEAGNDYIDGGAGFDGTNFSGATTGVYVVLGGTTAGFAYDGQGGIDTLLNIEQIYGSYYGDLLVGSDSGVFESFEGQIGNDTIDGKGGIDRVVYFGSRAAVTVDLAAGIATEFYAYGGMTMGTDTLLNIEWARGSQLFGDTLIGNAGANRLEGLGGDDTLDGGTGIDTMEGGAGSDVYLVRDVGDVVTETDRLRANGGDDTVKSFITVAMSSTGYVLGDLVENLHIEATAAANGAGNSLDNTIVANMGDNVLDGGFGTDTISYKLAVAGVTATIDAAGVGPQATGGSGTDTLLNFENIEGGSGNDSLTGSAVANWISGGGGADTLVGGLGNDTYVVDNAGDVVAETSANGLEIDHVISSITFSLAGLANVENLTLTGSAISGFGNGLANLLIGADGNGSLVGADGDDTMDGGLGSDTLVGGTGNDTYLVNSADDVVSEQAGQGTSDLVVSTISYSLVDTDGVGANGGNVENLRLNGLNAINGTGNALDNIIYAGEGDNVIDGGAGNDTVSYAHSQVLVAVNLGAVGGQATVGSGTDSLLSIENIEGSSQHDSLTGDGGANRLIGLAGNDLLNLMAGGNDTVLGGDGADFITAGGAGNMSINGGVMTNAYFGVDANTVNYSLSGVAVVLDMSGITGDGSSGSGTVSKGANGIDTLTNVNQYTGSNLNDNMTGSSSSTVWEFFQGGLGDDTINGGTINDRINGDDSNTIGYRDAPGAVVINLVTGLVTGAAGNDVISNFYDVRASNFDDSITGTAIDWLVEGFEGFAGDDTIDGGGGRDRARYNNSNAPVYVDLAAGVALDGLGGTDTLIGIEQVNGSRFSDTLLGSNTITGTGITDLSESFRGLAGNDTIDGRDGYDRADYLTATEGVFVTLGGTGAGVGFDGQGGVDTLLNIEAVRGSFFIDRLIGSDTATFESFAGMEGNDTIDGKGGTDRVEYGQSRAAVNVNLVTGVASDGYGGTDTLLNVEDVLGSSFNDVLVGNLGVNKFSGGAGNDNLSTSDGADFLDGGDGDDIMAGGAGGDTMHGGLGIDTLSGGKGGDRMFGGDGNDILNGNLGNDQMTGDAGADKFVFNAPLSATTNVDTLMDFVSGTDIVQLSASIFSAFNLQIGQTVGLGANLLYDSVTGVLSYDPDGAGAVAATNFAIIGQSVHPGTLGNDFQIVA